MSKICRFSIIIVKEFLWISWTMLARVGRWSKMPKSRQHSLWTPPNYCCCQLSTFWGNWEIVEIKFWEVIETTLFCSSLFSCLMTYYLFLKFIYSEKATKSWEISIVDLAVTKGQLISEWLLMSEIFQKINTTIWQISALEFRNWLHQKNKDPFMY